MFGVGDEAVEPVAEDFSVGVEQDDGAALAQAEGAVDRADEAEVALVLDEVEQAAAGEGGELRGEFRVGGAVVDGEQGEGGGLGRRQAGVDGAQGLAAALVDGDDDDDAGLRDGQGAGQAVPLVGRWGFHGRVGAEILGAAHQPGGPAGAHVVQERRLPRGEEVTVGLPVERDREGLARVPALVLPVGDEVGERGVGGVGVALGVEGGVEERRDRPGLVGQRRLPRIRRAVAGVEGAGRDVGAVHQRRGEAVDEGREARLAHPGMRVGVGLPVEIGPGIAALPPAGVAVVAHRVVSLGQAVARPVEAVVEMPRHQPRLQVQERVPVEGLPPDRPQPARVLHRRPRRPQPADPQQRRQRRASRPGIAQLPPARLGEVQERLAPAHVRVGRPVPVRVHRRQVQPVRRRERLAPGEPGLGDVTEERVVADRPAAGPRLHVAGRVEVRPRADPRPPALRHIVAQQRGVRGPGQRLGLRLGQALPVVGGVEVGGERLYPQGERGVRVGPGGTAVEDVVDQRVLCGEGDPAGEAVGQGVELRRRLAALAPARGHVVVDRVDAGGGEVGIAGEVEGAVDEAAGEAVGLGRVGPRQGGRLPLPARPAAPAREGVQERVDAGAGDVGVPGEVGGGVEVGARVAARAPAVDEVVAHRVGRDPVPARVERRVDVRGQDGDQARLQVRAGRRARPAAVQRRRRGQRVAQPAEAASHPRQGRDPAGPVGAAAHLRTLRWGVRRGPSRGAGSVGRPPSGRGRGAGL